MNRLEERYRRLLKVLPKSYRRQWEDDMVATYLLSMKQDAPEDDEFLADYGSPSAAEVRSVLALAVRLRLGGNGAPPEYLLFGDALRRFALLCFALQAALAVAGFGSWALYYIDPPIPPAPAFPPDVRSLLGALCPLLMVPALVLLLHGRRRAALLLSLASMTPMLIGDLQSAADGLLIPLDGAHWVTRLLPICALAAFHADAPPVNRRGWLLASGSATLCCAALLLGGRLLPPTLFLYTVDTSGIWCGYALCAAVGYAFSRRRRNASWSMAIAVLVVVALFYRVLTLAYYSWTMSPASAQHLMIQNGVPEAAVLAVIAVGAAALSHRTLSSYRAASTSPAPPEQRKPGSDR